jgi:hypothetical protein
MDPLHDVVRVRRDHGAALDPVALDLRARPEAGEREGFSPVDREAHRLARLFRVLRLHPLVETVGEDQAAVMALADERLVRPLLHDRLGLGVDHLVAGLQVLGPDREEAPADQAHLPPVFLLVPHHGEHLLGRRDVEPPGPGRVVALPLLLLRALRELAGELRFEAVGEGVVLLLGERVAAAHGRVPD